MTVFIAGFYFPLFYLQLDAISHGINKNFSFYAVEQPPPPTHSLTHPPPQLVIMNFSSFIGRLSPGLYANRLGIDNVVVIATCCCAILVLGIIAVKTVVSVVVIGIIYGFFAGICQNPLLLPSLDVIRLCTYFLFRYHDVGTVIGDAY
jgi:hypothetical protein